MRQPHESVTRTGLIRELATLLVTGRNCELLGPALLGKTPLLRDLHHLLVAEAPQGLTVALVDLEEARGKSWTDVARVILGVFRSQRLLPNQVIPDDWHLSDLVRHVLSSQPYVERLVLLFDHLEELSRNTLLRLATECSGIVNLTATDAHLSKVSMLWCGDESRIAEPIAHVQGFPRISEVRYIQPYCDQDMDALLDQYSRTFYLPPDARFRKAIKQLTGGLPGLARNFGDSFVAKLTPEVTGRLFPDAVSIAMEASDRYVADLVARIGNRTTDRHAVTAILANGIVDRVSSSDELLSLVFCMRLSDDMSAPLQEFPGVLTENSDFFVENAERIRCRGTIIQRFVHEYFTLARLALCFFTLDDTPQSWAKAMLCCQCLERERRGDNAGKGRLFDLLDTQNSAFRFLEALSSRLHGLRSPADVLDRLLLTVRHFLGAPACKIYEVAASEIRPVLCPANRLASPGALTIRSAPDFIRHAIITARTQEEEVTGNLAIPLQSELKVRYLLWVERSGGESLRQELIRTAATLAEGPISSALERERQTMLLREIVESNPEDRIQAIDSRRRIVLLSHRSREDARLGKDDSVFGKRCTDVFGTQCETCLCERVFNEKEPQRGTQERILRDETGRAQRRWFDVYCWPIWNQAGEVEIVCQSARDVSASLATLQATGKLLRAESADQVYDILIAAAEDMGFARGRLYLCQDPELGMKGELVSSRCFGHDRAFQEHFSRGQRSLSGPKESYWFDVFLRHESGVVCVQGDHYESQDPERTGELPVVSVPAGLEQIPELADTRRVRAQTALVAEGKCYGTLTTDMGGGADRLPHHLSYRLFELARMAAQTLVTIEARERVEMILRGFRHSLALPVGKFGMMVDVCLQSNSEECRQRAGRLAKSAVEDMFRMSENLAAQFSGGHAPLDLRDRDVVPSIREAIDAFRLSYEPFGVEVGYRGPDSVIARVDDVALRVVLRNLLDNAVRAIQRLDEVSSRRIEVRVIPTAQARVQRIEVEDSGPGVPPELGDSIYQVGVSSSSSSGIGLPACRFFASMMGAFLDHVQGTALGGANFRVKFEGQSE